MKARLIFSVLLFVGLGAGLTYAWLIEPVTFTESSPALVQAAYRQTWLIMTAEAYAQDGDWDRTQARLTALRDPDLARTVADLFEQEAARGDRSSARALALIADRLGAQTAAMSVFLVTPAVTPTPPPPVSVIASPTPKPTATAIPTQPAPTITPTSVALSLAYQLVNRTAECTRASTPPQIRVFVQNAAGVGLAGRDVWITWENGADRFVTGLKPEIDAGYGDFEMMPDRAYNVSIDQPTAVVATNLQAAPCPTGLTSWRLIFRQTTR